MTDDTQTQPAARRVGPDPRAPELFAVLDAAGRVWDGPHETEAEAKAALAQAAHVPDPVVMEGLRGAWCAGYQSAVDALREMADEFGNEQCKAVIRAAAITLQEMKP